MSDNKADIVLPAKKSNIKQLLQLTTLYRHPASRFAFCKQGKQTLLFVDGEDFSVSAAFAKILCKEREVDITSLLKTANDAEQQLLVTLYTQGKLVKSL